MVAAEQRTWLACENVRVLQAITRGPKTPTGHVRAWLDALRVLVDFVVHGIAPERVWIPREPKFSDAQAKIIFESPRRPTKRQQRCQRRQRGAAT